VTQPPEETGPTTLAPIKPTCGQRDYRVPRVGPNCGAV
jgi:hypothetical protein